MESHEAELSAPSEQFPETKAESQATINEATTSSTSKDEFETPLKTGSQAEPQQPNTASTGSDLVSEHGNEFDLTEESIESTDLNTISSSEPEPLDVTGEINDPQLESDSPSPMSDSDIKASTDDESAVSVQFVNIENTGDKPEEPQESAITDSVNFPEQSLNSETSLDSVVSSDTNLTSPEEAVNLQDPSIISNTQPALDPAHSAAEYDDTAASKTMEATPVEPSPIDENMVISQDIEEKETRETGTEDEQPLKSESVEDTNESASLDLDPTAETLELEEAADIPPETSQDSAESDADKTISDHSSEVLTSKHQNPKETISDEIFRHDETADNPERLPVQLESDVHP